MTLNLRRAMTGWRPFRLRRTYGLAPHGPPDLPTIAHALCLFVFRLTPHFSLPDDAAPRSHAVAHSAHLPALSSSVSAAFASSRSLRVSRLGVAIPPAQKNPSAPELLEFACYVD